MSTGESQPPHPLQPLIDILAGQKCQEGNILNRLDSLISLLERTSGVSVDKPDIYFAIPWSGGKFVLQPGTTLFDFMEGKITRPDKTTLSMKLSLRASGFDYCRSLRIDPDDIMDISMDSGSGTRSLDALTPLSLSRLEFTALYITVKEETLVRVFAATSTDSMVESASGGASSPWKTGDTFTLEVGTTVLPLSDTPVKTRGVTIKANDNNEGILYWGFRDDITVNDGFPLLASQVADVPIDLLSKLYILADRASQYANIAWGV